MARGDEHQVEFVSRQVIEQKLLTALAEGGVAALLSEQDIKDLIFACDVGQRHCRITQRRRLANLLEGLEKLKKEAFL